MVEYVRRPFGEINISRQIYLLGNNFSDVLVIVNIGFAVNNNHHFIEHHLPGTPQGIHHLDSLSGIRFFNFNNNNIMKNTFRRHIHVHHFGKHAHFDGFYKNALGSLAQPRIFLWRNADDGRRINGIPAMCDTGNMKTRVIIR